MKKIAVKFLSYLLIVFVLMISIYTLGNFDGGLASFNVLLKLGLGLFIILGTANLVGDTFRLINLKSKKGSAKKIEEELSDDIKSVSKSLVPMIGSIFIIIIILFLVLIWGIS